MCTPMVVIFINLHKILHHIDYHLVYNLTLNFTDEKCFYSAVAIAFHRCLHINKNTYNETLILLNLTPIKSF